MWKLCVEGAGGGWRVCLPIQTGDLALDTDVPVVNHRVVVEVVVVEVVVVEVVVVDVVVVCLHAGSIHRGSDSRVCSHLWPEA